MTNNIFSIIHTFSQRREYLGISLNRLAQITKISLPTMQRFFAGHAANISLETVSKIATALGMNLSLQETADEQTILEKQAREKAHALASMVQGTSSLEAQGLPADAYKAIENKLFYELMAGPRRKLWSE